ncbi:hypothetical protein L3Q67_01400 [Saccharothrix sp. AJ9571]|nr:hypothetical protein L3Q67_01400 [Saccharothrix sp. AJ9571]
MTTIDLVHPPGGPGRSGLAHDDRGARPEGEDACLAEDRPPATAAPAGVEASARARQGPATACAAPLPPGTVVVLATADSVDVAARTRSAERAVRSLSRLVLTALIDTGAAPTAAAAVHGTGSGGGEVRVLVAPGSSWCSAVALGLTYAHDLRAETVLVLDPAEPADEPADDPAAPGASVFAAAVTQLEAQKKPGVVCCPQARPWWQDPLSLHVLRPLCLPALGFAPDDPLGATLVLSQAAVTAALQPRWGLEHSTSLVPHALDILTAARTAGLTVSQTEARQPPAGHSRLAAEPSINRNACASVLPAAVRLCALAVPAFRTSLPATRIPLTGAAAHPPPPDLFPRLARHCEQEARAGRASTDTWPEPLVTLWQRARAPRLDATGLADDLWPPYLRWLISSYRDATDLACADPTQVVDHCIARAERATREFLDAIVRESARVRREGQR